MSFFAPKWQMMQIKDEVYDVDMINAMSEQLIRFIMGEILDPRGEFYNNGHINRLSALTSWGA